MHARLLRFEKLNVLWSSDGSWPVDLLSFWEPTALHTCGNETPSSWARKSCGQGSVDYAIPVVLFSIRYYSSFWILLIPSENCNIWKGVVYTLFSQIARASALLDITGDCLHTPSYLFWCAWFWSRYTRKWTLKIVYHTVGNLSVGGTVRPVCVTIFLPFNLLSRASAMKNRSGKEDAATKHVSADLFESILALLQTDKLLNCINREHVLTWLPWNLQFCSTRWVLSKSPAIELMGYVHTYAQFIERCQRMFVGSRHRWRGFGKERE